MEDAELIAVRIKDGIFAGNVAAAEDREFLGMNKISHVINCAGGEVADYFIGDPELRYLSFPWKDVAGSVCTTVLFDSADENITKAVEFIDEAMASGDCVLVHSFNGISRSPALIAAYLIVKYGWKLESALAFLQMAHPDVNIKPHFLRQLRLFAKRHQVAHDVFDRDVDDTRFGLDNDQWMLRNTLLNGLTFGEQEGNELYAACVKKVDVGTKLSKPRSKVRISFVDTKMGTEVDAPGSTPVVPGRASAVYADPASGSGNRGSEDTFVGAQGPTALRTGRRSPSILSRSTSPCSRHLESDPGECPKGRQDLRIVAPAKQPAPVSQPPEPKTVPSVRATQVAAIPSEVQPVGVAAPSGRRQPETKGPVDAVSISEPVTAQSSQLAEGQEKSTGSSPEKVSYYERLAPPRSKGTGNGSLPARSPLATLTSKHKYRNGSPMPLQKDKQKGEKKPRMKVISIPSSRPTSATNSLDSPRGQRSSSASSQKRTGSPGTAPRGRNGAVAPASGPTVTRGPNSRYGTIAPQRSASGNSRPAWNSSISSDSERPNARRPYSPTLQGPARQRSSSANSQTSSLGDKTKPSTRRSPSKTKKRSSSLQKKSTGRTPPPSPLNVSTRSIPSSPTSQADSPTKKGTSTSSSGKLRRQPPAAISSRRQ